jgi:hypothetical protein
MGCVPLRICAGCGANAHLSHPVEHSQCPPPPAAISPGTATRRSTQAITRFADIEMMM